MVTMNGLYLIGLLVVAGASEDTPAQRADGLPPVGPVPFFHEARALSPAEIQAMTGVTWREGCPVGPSDLRLVGVVHWTGGGRVAWGQVVVAASAVAPVIDAMKSAYEEGFVIERMQPMVNYNGDDRASMADNNTSAFNCRESTGGGGWSAHALGVALDVNPVQNPYVRGELVLPPAGVAHLDRTHLEPGMLHASSALVKVLGAHGWGWGGKWRSLKDYQHLSATGR